MTPHEARLFLAHGSKLDALAATVAGLLQETFPAYAVELERNRRDELEHAQVQARLAGGVRVSQTFTKRAYACSYNPGTVDPVWSLVLLNFIERRSIAQFRLAYRVLRHPDLLQIAADEARHARLGGEMLRSLDLTPAAIRQALADVTRIDEALDPCLRAGLDALNHRTARRLLEELKP